MENNKYLSEESYQKSKNKTKRISTIILIVGLLIGISLITLGVMEKLKINSEYSLENKQNRIDEIESKIEIKETELKSKINQLKSNSIEYDVFAKYTDGEVYDLKIITNALDPSFNNCAFDEYKNNINTKEYCLLKEELKKIETTNVDFERNFNFFGSTTLIMFGVFAIIATFMISGAIYMITKRREMMAFTTSQVMPIAKESLEEITPSVAEFGKEFIREVTPTAKEIAKEMAPIYSEIAKEVAKSVKEGLKEEEK